MGVRFPPGALMDISFEEVALELIASGDLPKEYLTKDGEGRIYVKEEVRDGITEKDHAIYNVVSTLLKDKDATTEDLREGLTFIKRLTTPWSKRDECEDCTESKENDEPTL